MSASLDFSLLPNIMKVAFRVDAAISIGIGHVMRCLTLADALHARGAQCLFICRAHAGHIMQAIAEKGHQVTALPDLSSSITALPAESEYANWLGADWETDAFQTLEALAGYNWDWLIVDHYAVDARWERIARNACRRLMVIDDLANRQHDCDLLLDQNLGRHRDDYTELIAPTCEALIGPKYALLRPEFAELRAESLTRRVNPVLKRILITMGGVDKDNVTGQILDALRSCELPHDIVINVVMGTNAPWLDEVKRLASDMPHNTEVLIGVSNMARLMTDADLAIGAAGSTSWERCCMGLPSIQIVLASNQISAASALTNLGAVRTLSCGLAEQIELKQLIHTFCIDHRILNCISENASLVCDGNGIAYITETLCV
jgi:UDP-2,4-diacetamido-2,4,6-trideoxy-beta-L-altropyranose hydrolase